MNDIAAFGWHPRVAAYEMRPDHPLKPYRYRLTKETLERLGAFRRSNARLLEGRRAEDAEIELVHDPSYIDRVKRFSEEDPSIAPEEWGDVITWSDTPPWPGMHEDQATIAGTSLACMEAVLAGEARVGFNGSGGLHHAMRDRPSGFCVYNDPAIVVAALLRRRKRVAYVDIDAHHGDGVQAAFYETDRVLTISLHQYGFIPELGRLFFPGSGRPSERGSGAGAGYKVNVALARGTDDLAYAKAFDAVVPPLVRAFAPDVLVTQGGFDTYWNCPIAQLALSTRGYERCYRAFKELGLPWVALGGGGYDVDAVRRGWSIAYLVMLGADVPAELHDDDSPRSEGRVRAFIDDAANRAADEALAASFLGSRPG